MTDAENQCKFGLSHMTTSRDTPPQTPGERSEPSTEPEHTPDQVAKPPNAENAQDGKTPKPETDETPETPTLREPTPVETPGGFPLVRGGAGELVPQAHGGALRRGNPGNAGLGGRAAAETRRARAERDEAIDDAVTGHIEKLSDILGQLVDEAGGEQYRCSCGRLGPKVPKLKLKEATEVAAIMMRAVKQPDTAVTVIPIQINVHAGGPMTPGRLPDQ